MKLLPLLSLLIALPSICHATIDATDMSRETGIQIRLPSLDGRGELGSGAVIISPGGDLAIGSGNGIPYPAVVESAPGGQIVIRGGELGLSAGDGTLRPSASAIPEPQRYAMLLSGVVVISGLMALRK